MYSIGEVMLMILFGCRKLVRSSLASSCARLLLQSWVPWVPKNIEFHTWDICFSVWFSWKLDAKENFLYQVWVKPTFCPKIAQPLLIWILAAIGLHSNSLREIGFTSNSMTKILRNFKGKVFFAFRHFFQKHSWYQWPWIILTIQ